MGVAGADRETQPQELGQDVALGVLGGGPAVGGGGVGAVRDGAGEGAGEALGGGIAGQDHPVALMGGGAAGAGFVGEAGEGRMGVGVAAVVLGGKGKQPPAVREVTDKGPAAQAGGIPAEEGYSAGADGGWAGLRGRNSGRDGGKDGGHTAHCSHGAGRKTGKINRPASHRAGLGPACAGGTAIRQGVILRSLQKLNSHSQPVGWFSSWRSMVWPRHGVRSREWWIQRPSLEVMD